MTFLEFLWMLAVLLWLPFAMAADLLQMVTERATRLRGTASTVLALLLSHGLILLAAAQLFRVGLPAAPAQYGHKITDFLSVADISILSATIELQFSSGSAAYHILLSFVLFLVSCCTLAARFFLTLLSSITACIAFISR